MAWPRHVDGSHGETTAMVIGVKVGETRWRGTEMAGRSQMNVDLLVNNAISIGEDRSRDGLRAGVCMDGVVS